MKAVSKISVNFKNLRAYHFITRYTAMKGYYNKSRGASRLSRHETNRTAVNPFSFATGLDVEPTLYRPIRYKKWRKT